jgi:hypothetical protein
MSPKDNNKQVSAAVRILQQKRDVSARATHLMVKNDSLITYEKAISDQADKGKFPESTFLERKIMSTKTSFKRIALVAASALAIAGFSAVPANAAHTSSTLLVNATYGTGSGTAAGTQVVGGLIEVALTETSTSGVLGTVTSTGVGSIASVVLATNTTVPASTTYPTTNLTLTTSDDDAADVHTFTLTSAVAGTQTLTFTPIASTGAPGSPKSVTITWGAATSLNLTTLQVSTLTDARETAGDCSVANKAVDGHNGLVRSPASTVSDSGSICILAMNGAGAVKSLSSLTITSTGPGLVGAADGDSPSSYGLAGAATGLTGEAAFNVAGSGVAGIATYSVSAKSLNADGVTSTTLTGSVKVTFVGSAVASATIDQATAGKYALADSADATVVASFSLKDSGTSVMAGGATGNLLVDSDIASTLTVDAAGEEDAAATVTVSQASSVAADGTETKGTISVDCATGQYEKLSIWLHFESNTVPSNKITVYCTGTAAETFVLAVPSMSAGDQADVTVTATAGITGKLDYPVADAQTATFSTTQGTLSNTSAVNFKNGVATVKFSAPLIGGNVILTAKPASVTATSAVTVASGVSSTLVVEGDATASLALDAANAATDAANNAYDEAQNATQAASDALAAVTALAAQVKSLIASVKKLTAAVAKLKK